MIHIKNVTVEGRLDNVTFEIPANQQVHIIGPNGSGKSTLLASLAGVISYEGQIILNNTEISTFSLEELSKVRAYLAQNEKPVFNVTVYEYLRLSLPVHVTLSHKKVTDVVSHLIDLLNVRDKLTSSIHQLSGGEWQRVRIIGCCLQVWPELNPDGELLILDEPAAPLDIGQERYLYSLLNEAKEQGLSVIMANHDLNRSLQYSEYVVLLSDSKSVCCGMTDEVVTAKTIQNVFHTGVQQIEIEEKRHLIFD
ncbi:vitamin B12 ABC transporter ATP-binding protein BtuD [Vibrio salinus]|uniref:vitamin B12 ABC transporter ATP-binding protein BtuD n=1 Tax=Vibrio salinus TaxID=2899784 RepID=UPI001E3539BC|nr:vitamin B12 ABC transporter ATP-binding protein BtuD [Vibrio salinus]MCE0496306.1 vitamin B12 ABC transporter ATP-binding protein BtuD [Vibrio salinus]